MSETNRTACVYQHGFDMTQFYRGLSERFGLRGLMALAMARIEILLKGSIVFVSFINIEGNSPQIRFRALEGSDVNTTYPHYLIAFTSGDSNTIKRYWYFQHDLLQSNGFEKLARQLPVDTLLLKGVPGLFRGRTRSRALSLALTAARRSDASVLTDVQSKRSGHEFEESGQPYNIWRAGYRPEEIAFDEVSSFGYSISSTKSPIYSGMGTHLIEEGAMMMSLGRSVWESAKECLVDLRLVIGGSNI